MSIEPDRKWQRVILIWIKKKKDFSFIHSRWLSSAAITITIESEREKEMDWNQCLIAIGMGSGSKQLSNK